MDLNELITDLLYTHDCVVIPGVGGFLLNYSPATIQPVQHYFCPPSRTVAFNSALQTNDGLVAKTMADRFGVSYSEAVERLKSFASEVSNNLQTVGYYSFEGIGKLVDEGDGLIRFEPGKGVNLLADAFGLPSFTSPAIDRGSYHAVSQLTRTDRRPKRKSGALPVAARWMLMLLPVVLVSAWMFFSPFDTGSLPDQASMGIETLTKPDAAVKKQVPEVKNVSAGDEMPASAKPGETGEAPVAQNPVSATGPEINKTDNQVQKNNIEASEPAPAGMGYVIVGGCFAEKSNALNFVEKLKAQGYDGYMDGMTRSGLQRVCIGRYQSYSEALAKLEIVRQEVSPEAWLLKN